MKNYMASSEEYAAWQNNASVGQHLRLESSKSSAAFFMVILGEPEENGGVWKIEVLVKKRNFEINTVESLMKEDPEKTFLCRRKPTPTHQAFTPFYANIAGKREEFDHIFCVPPTESAAWFHPKPYSGPSPVCGWEEGDEDGKGKGGCCCIV